MRATIVTTKEKITLTTINAGDDELLRRLQEADRDAFTAIYMRYHEKLYIFAMHYLKNRDDTEDILQSVFVKLWTSHDMMLGVQNLRRYLFAMTKNMVINHIRNSNNALQHNYRLVQSQPSADDDLYTYAERNHLTEVLQMAIRNLPPQQRIVATMRCEGYSNAEIAARMNLSVNTVNTHYRSVVKTLKRCLNGFARVVILYMMSFLEL